MTVKTLRRAVSTTATGLWWAAAAGSAFGHGLIQSPPSRNWLCGAITKPDHVLNGVAQYPVCGDAFNAPGIQFTDGYSFMSVLTHTQGRAVLGPRANVCSYNSETWNGNPTVWDQAIDWPTNNVTSGPQTFTWNISWGPHFSDTQEFRYWITRPDFQFQVGQPLSFGDFEETPFCTLFYDDANPTANPNVTPNYAASTFDTRCNVPQRTGRHVVYAEWGRNPATFERFHGCVDVVFQGTGSEVDARIALVPDVTEFTGSGQITLDGRSSAGSNLSFQWTVSSQNPELYTIDDADQAVATLNLGDPQAASNVTVALVVSNGSASDSATRTIVHRPSVTSQWFDLGPVTSEPQTMTPGDRLSIRTVTQSGQDAFWPASPLVVSAGNAAADLWPLALAQAVNAMNGDVRAGVIDAQDQVAPVQSATANRVFARNTTGIVSAFLQIVPADVPAAPTGLAATPGNSQVQLTWNASTGATSYNVKRSLTNGGPYANVATGVTATAFTDAGLTNGTTYYYVVTAVNASGESPVSSQASAMPQDSSGVTVQVVIQNTWTSGYCANLIVTNNTSQPVTWNVGFTVEGTIYTAWNAVIKPSSGQVTASGVGWNSVLQPGQSTHSVGFCANR
jgi:chitin-binding protein